MQSFKQCADVYNYLNKETVRFVIDVKENCIQSHSKSFFSESHTILNQRVKVDRRRIEEAFLQYALLRVASWYPEKLSLSCLPLHTKTIEILPTSSVGLSWSIYEEACR